MAFVSDIDQLNNAEYLQRMIEQHGDSGECLIWGRGKDSKGYGRLRWYGQMRGAHVVALEITEPRTDPDAFVLHSCDNPLCFNPKHLRYGTNAENMADMVERGRAASQTGEANGYAKLDEMSVRAIRALYELAGLTQRQIAAAFGISHPQVSRIVRGEQWGHLDDEPDEPETPLFDAWLREYELGLSGDELEEFREGVARLRSTDDGAGRG